MCKYINTDDNDNDGHKNNIAIDVFKNMMNKISLSTTAMMVATPTPISSNKHEKTVIQKNEKVVIRGKYEKTVNDPNSLFPPQLATLPLEQVGHHQFHYFCYDMMIRFSLIFAYFRLFTLIFAYFRLFSLDFAYFCLFSYILSSTISYNRNFYD